MIRVKVDTEPLEKALAAMLAKLKDRRPLMRKIAGDMMDAVEENFEKEGRPGWKPLSPATVSARARKGHWPGRILQVSGMLHNSVSSRHDDSTAVVGTNLAYAGVHQFGGLITRYPQSRLARPATKKSPARRAHTVGQYTVTIPARPFLALTPQDYEHIRGTIRLHLEGAK